jgi:hypothetical protein
MRLANQGANRRAIGRSLSLLVVIGFVGACTSATTGESPAAATAQPTAASIPSTAPSAVESAMPSQSAVASSEAAATPLPTAVATAIDPCQLVTLAEVNQLSGGQFPAGSGQGSTTEGKGKVCSYGEEGVTFDVVVGVAPDVATAKAGEQAFEAELQKDAANILKVTELKGFAGGTADAATLYGSKTIGGVTYGGSAIYVLRGTTFFGITDIASMGGKAPSTSAMEDEAKVVLGRLP